MSPVTRACLRTFHFFFKSHRCFEFFFSFLRSVVDGQCRGMQVAMCVVGISSFAVPSVLSSAVDAFRGKAALLLPQYCRALSLPIALLSLSVSKKDCVQHCS